MAGGPFEDFIEVRADSRGLAVDFESACAGRNPADESRGRIYLSGSSDGREDIAAFECFLDALHFERHLAEPDDVGTESTRDSAAGARSLGRKLVTPFEDRSCSLATRAKKLAVHVDQVTRPCAVVKVVDVLRDEKYLSVVFPLEARQCQVRGIGLHLRRLELRAPRIVETVNEHGIPLERFRSGDVLEAVVFPESSLVAEGPDP